MSHPILGSWMRLLRSTGQCARPVDSDILKEAGGESGDFQIAHDKYDRGIPSSIKRGFGSSCMNKTSNSWTVLQNGAIV